MKVYYPFANFKSRSKEGETYTVNLRPPNEVSCTCGAWKYYRNKEGNSGNCIHTKAVRETFAITWVYSTVSTNTDVYPIILEVVTKNNSFTQSIPIDVLDNMIDPVIVGSPILNSIFSRLAKELVKDKRNQLKALKDFKKEIFEQSEIPNSALGASIPIEEITWKYPAAFEKIKQLLERWTSFPPQKIESIMKYIMTDYDEQSIESSVFDYKKSRHITLLSKNS